MLELAILQYVLRKDRWDAGFSENKKILFTLFVNAIFICNVPIVKKNIVKKNRLELISYHRTRIVLLNMLGTM